MKTSSQTVEPIVQLDAGGRIAACGVRITTGATIAIGAVVVELVNRRTGNDAMVELSAMGLAVDGTAATGPDDGRQPRDVTLTTATTDTAGLLGQARPRREGGVVAAAKVEPGAGARLFQELMVSGATVKINVLLGGTFSWTLQGPMPQRVRAAYLNCAGDLFPRTR